jgi:hypothetical protein
LTLFGLLSIQLKERHLEDNQSTRTHRSTNNLTLFERFLRLDQILESWLPKTSSVRVAIGLPAKHRRTPNNITLFWTLLSDAANLKSLTAESTSGGHNFPSDKRLQKRKTNRSSSKTKQSKRIKKTAFVSKIGQIAI